jgi:predicted NBD/HSP70 family sugar kinase
MASVLQRMKAADMVRLSQSSRPGPSGPPAGLWSINPHLSLVVGIELSATELNLAVSGLDGTRLAECRHPAGTGPDVGQELADAVALAAREAGCPAGDFESIVLGIPGVVVPETGRLSRVAVLPRWDGFNIPAFAAKALNCQNVMVENDANLAALAERAHGVAAGVDEFFLLWIGSGLGMGIVMNGQLLRGRRGSAGEIGTQVVPDRSSLHTFGRGGGSLADLLADGPITDMARYHGFETTPGRQAVAEACADPGKYGWFLDDLAVRIATCLINAIGLVDPDLVVLGGPIGQVITEPLIGRVVDFLGTELLSPLPAIRATEIRGDAVRDGAVEYGLAQVRKKLFQTGSAGLLSR